MESAMSIELMTRRRFTVDEYHRMSESGILRVEDRVELIRGEIVHMSPIGPRQAACVALLTEALVGRLGGRAVVWPQNPSPSCPIPSHSLTWRCSDSVTTATGAHCRRLATCCWSSRSPTPRFATTAK
jgi:hypothetical protein